MTNLKKLADLKLKLDLVTELYEKEEAEIKKQESVRKLTWPRRGRVHDRSSGKIFPRFFPDTI